MGKRPSFSVLFKRESGCAAVMALNTVLKKNMSLCTSSPWPKQQLLILSLLHRVQLHRAIEPATDSPTRAKGRSHLCLRLRLLRLSTCLPLIYPCHRSIDRVKKDNEGIACVAISWNPLFFLVHGQRNGGVHYVFFKIKEPPFIVSSPATGGSTCPSMTHDLSK